MRRRFSLVTMFAAVAVTVLSAQTPPAPPTTITAIKAGRLLDPETGTAAANQVVIIEGEKIKAVGVNLPIPAGAAVIDLSNMTVMPGLVDSLTDIDALRNVRFVMKYGMVFKQDGVMMPEDFFHPGPVRTPNGRWTR
jgi:hypothetical protein